MATLSIDATAYRRAAEALEQHQFLALEGQTVGAVLRQSGTIIRRHIRAALAPHRRTGKTASHISAKPQGTGLATVVTVKAASRTAHLLEDGTRLHDISAGYESKFGFRGNLTGGSSRPQALTIRGAGSANSAFAGFGSRALRGAGADVLALRRAVHHPGTHATHFFEEGVHDAAAEVQARVDRGAATMANNLAERLG